MGSFALGDHPSELFSEMLVGDGFLVEREGEVVAFTKYEYTQTMTPQLVLFSCLGMSC